MRSPRRLPSWLLVALQFGLIAALVLGTDWKEARHPGLLSIALFALGAALGLWTISVNHWGNFNIRPEVKRGARLITTGPYRWIRHPMYSAVLLGMAAFVAADATAIRLALLVALLFVLAIKAQHEETHLRAAFADYVAYASRTQRFVPLLW